VGAEKTRQVWNVKEIRKRKRSFIVLVCGLRLELGLRAGWC
jgi:hypothetical protein